MNVKKPLFWAVLYKKVEIIKWLIERPDLQINALDSDGATALFWVVDVFHPSENDDWFSVINMLVQAGIDSSIKNKAGRTVFDVACEYKDDEVIELI